MGCRLGVDRLVRPNTDAGTWISKLYHMQALARGLQLCCTCTPQPVARNSSGTGAFAVAIAEPAKPCLCHAVQSSSGDGSSSPSSSACPTPQSWSGAYNPNYTCECDSTCSEPAYAANGRPGACDFSCSTFSNYPVRSQAQNAQLFLSQWAAKQGLVSAPLS